MTIHVTPIPRLIDLAAPAFTLGTANAAGTAETAVASDSTLLAFDTTLPAATGTAAVGTATTAPRRDHVHTGTILAAPSLTLGTANSAGAATTALATNSTILAFDDTAVDAITLGQSGAVGSATVASRRDHAHAMEDVNPASQAEMEAGTSNAVFVTPLVAVYASGVAKAWSVYDNDGTFESLLTYNVALTDTAVGQCAHAFGTDFSTANWSAAGSSDENASFRKQSITDATVDAQFRTTAGQALVDSNFCSVIFFGDQ